MPAEARANTACRSRFPMKKLVIYTAITGEYDTLAQPDCISDGIDYICFTDKPHVSRSGAWEMRAIPATEEKGDPIRLSRFPKINPHLLLTDYEFSLWTDANITVGRYLTDLFLEMSSRNETCAITRHPDRDCVYEEARYLLQCLIGDPADVYRQAIFLKKSGFPPHAGLHMCSVIHRKHMTPEAVKFSQIWWKTYVRFSKRDQMCADYALLGSGIKAAGLMPPEKLIAMRRPHTAHAKANLSARLKKYLSARMFLALSRFTFPR